MDNIREEDKYGNNGGKLDVVGGGIVTGVEKVTTLISSAVDVCTKINWVPFLCFNINL